VRYVLEAEDVFFTYPDGTRALNGLTMRVPAGKKVAVLGKNGSGKSTLFLHFNGLQRPQKGVVKFNGSAVSYEKRALKLLRKSVGIVFQDPDDQLFSASVYQDVSFGPLNLGWPEEKTRRKVEEVLRQTGLWEEWNKPVHFLSHGQKKRAAIAGVLAMEPEVIVLDEPTAGLDPAFGSDLLSLLDKFNREGAAVIVSSHNTDEIYAWADHVFVLERGRVIGEGSPVEVFRREDVLKKAGLVKPWVLDVFDRLAASGKLDKKRTPPHKREELLDILGV
jgi:cobalt/nickel transport system ATP-binding protein